MSNLTIVYVPGLQGDKGIAAGDVSVPQSNRAAVEAAASILGADFKLAAYQTRENPFPTLDEMGETVRLQLDDIARSGHQILVVGSSTGFGVVFPSLREGDHVIGLLPVPSPVEAIELQVKLTAPQAMPLLEQVKAGQGTFPLPVGGTADGPEQGVFVLEQKHFQGLRLLSDPASQQVMDKRLDGKSITSMHLITAENDPLSKMTHDFRCVAAYQGWIKSITSEVISGGHGDRRFDEVKNAIVAQAHRLRLTA